jgi:hypothetical protein
MKIKIEVEIDTNEDKQDLIDLIKALKQELEDLLDA